MIECFDISVSEDSCDDSKLENDVDVGDDVVDDDDGDIIVVFVFVNGVDVDNVLAGIDDIVLEKDGVDDDDDGVNNTGAFVDGRVFKNLDDDWTRGDTSKVL